MTSLDYARACFKEKKKEFPQAELPPKNKFHYHAGVFLHGTQELYVITGDEEYNDYAKLWIDSFIDENGSISGVTEGVLDDIQPCNLLIQYVREDKTRTNYAAALASAAEKLKNWKCNQYGGFWHMDRFPNQMWLDSVYMGSVLAVRYGLMTDDKELLELAERQMTLMWDNMRDEETGLLSHAWDASGEAVWADEKTGRSPEFWGRAIGWYFATACIFAEILPDGAFRDKMLRYAKTLAESLLRFQDKKSGMWYQIVNRTEDMQNWVETSCSCLYTYGLCKLIRLGVLDEERVKTAAKRGYGGVIRDYVSLKNGDFVLSNVCKGTGVGDYTHYINRPTEENDLHGMGAFLLMCTEYYKCFKE